VFGKLSSSDPFESLGSIESLFADEDKLKKQAAKQALLRKRNRTSVFMTTMTMKTLQLQNQMQAKVFLVVLPALLKA
jgi:hypothetical protein